jgi:hypothetical protein
MTKGYVIPARYGGFMKMILDKAMRDIQQDILEPDSTSAIPCFVRDERKTGIVTLTLTDNKHEPALVHEQIVLEPLKQSA